MDPIKDKTLEPDIKSVDGYIHSFSAGTQLILEKVRLVIREKAPEAVEGIAYGMPSYKANGKPLVYFAGYKNHIGFYATSTGHSAFEKELSAYKQGKGSVQFPLDKPIPYDLIGKIVEFRLKEIRLKKKTNL